MHPIHMYGIVWYARHPFQGWCRYCARFTFLQCGDRLIVYRRLATSQQSPGPSPSSVNAPGKQNEACNSKGHETLAAVTSIHSSPSEATPEAELPAESTDVAESTLQEASTLRTCKRGEAWEDEETMHSHHGDSMQSESTITLD